VLKYNHSISVIIPAHNEEQHIGACIESLLSQTVPVDEIIVVVNGSSDRTSSIAKKYKKVKVLETEVSGLINARNIGFNIAKSITIARLNADVVCDPTWNESIKNIFSKNSSDAIAGVAKTAVLPFWPYFNSTFWSKIYLWYAEAYFGIPILWGANMVIKSSAWDQIKNSCCLIDKEVHEDQDISIHLAINNLKVVNSGKCVVNTLERSYYDWSKFHHYNQIRKKTKKMHKGYISLGGITALSIFGRIWRFVVTSIPSAVFSFSSLIRFILSHQKQR